MKVYVAIGYFKDDKHKNIEIIAMQDSTKANFYRNCQGNAFAACAVMTENKVREILAADIFDRWEMVKKLTNNYRKWMELDELFGDHAEMFLEKIEEAKC